MLQNRVDPYGHIIKTSARGHWTGTRGILHDEQQNILRPFKLKAWLTCLLQFKGRKRQVMAPNRYTSLFFWDEATAFVAGHRPCCECRRQDYNRFKHFWLLGNKEYGFKDGVSIQEIDKILHTERIDGKGAKVTYEADIKDLPDGSFIDWEGKAWVILKGAILPWTVAGYGKGVALPVLGKAKVLTPKSMVNAFRVGYVVEVNVG
jgi:hypothetical protein